MWSWDCRQLPSLEKCHLFKVPLQRGSIYCIPQDNLTPSYIWWTLNVTRNLLAIYHLRCAETSCILAILFSPNDCRLSTSEAAVHPLQWQQSGVSAQLDLDRIGQQSASALQRSLQESNINRVCPKYQGRVKIAKKTSVGCYNTGRI